jgi:hypothetical protein
MYHIVDINYWTHMTNEYKFDILVDTISILHKGQLLWKSPVVIGKFSAELLENQENHPFLRLCYKQCFTLKLPKFASTNSSSLSGQSKIVISKSNKMISWIT